MDITDGVNGAELTTSISGNMNTFWMPSYVPYISGWGVSTLFDYCCGNTHVFGCEHAMKCKCGQASRPVPKCCHCGKAHS